MKLFTSNYHILSLIVVVILASACSSTKQTSSTISNSKRIKASQSSLYNENTIYDTYQKEHEVGICKIEMNDLCFDVSPESIEKQKVHWKNFHKTNLSHQQSSTNSTNIEYLLSTNTEMNTYPSFSKEAEFSNVSTEVIDLRKAFANGLMTPKVMMK